jgi:hypothetical protein
MKPTEQEYTELQQAFDFFNAELFSGKLPSCIITLQREYRTYGYFSNEAFESRTGDVADEIAMNPLHFGNRPVKDVLSTLVHEMVHLWQHHLGKPGRGRYHNKQWAAKMEEIGLFPSDTGEPGGKRTGDKMSHYIVEGGRYDQAYTKLIAGRDGFTISWFDRISYLLAPIEISGTEGGSADDEDGDGEPKRTNKSNRVKYSCPNCKLNVWGKPEIYVICGACDEAMSAAG